MPCPYKIFVIRLFLKHQRGGKKRPASPGKARRGLADNEKLLNCVNLKMVESMKIRGVSLFTKIMGDGPPILMMHGGPGVDHTSLLPLKPLADTYRLIYYDHRCNGRSTGTPVDSMTWDNLTADADALRQQLGIDQWVVLGHSFGGMVAQEYALRYPDSLSGLILVDTCADISWVQERVPQRLAEDGYSPRAVEAARRFFNGELAPQQTIPFLLRFSKAYTYRFNLRAQLTGMRIKHRPEPLIFGFKYLLRGWNIMERLEEISIPTLIMAGRHDFQFPPPHQEEMCEAIPNAKLEIIEKAGHNAPIERPTVVIEKIRDFLSGIGVG